MSRLLTDLLSRGKVTITELIHRADMLEATGTVYQHTIQKVAVVQAANTTTPVQQIVKSLNELTTQAFNRVYRDQRKGLFPDPAPEQFAELAAKLAGQGDAAYIFNGALARHLKDAKGWDHKVLMLITIMKKPPAEEAPRKLLLSSIDAVLAEILNGSAALQDLMGPAENLDQALNQLVNLFLGKLPEGSKAGLAALTHHFAADSLPEARTAVANRIVMGVGKYLSHDDLIAAFTLRSKRLVANEAMGQHIAEAPIEEKVERIMFVEDNIIDTENKRQLSTYIMPVLNSAAFENHFQNPKLPLVQRLQRLAQLQARVRRSGFIEVTRQEIAVKMAALAVHMEARGKLFESIEARSTNPVEKAQTLLKLATGNLLTEGQLSNKARELILGYMSKPGFLTGYMAAQSKDGAAPDSEKLMAELMETLGKAGITADTGLESIAA